MKTYVPNHIKTLAKQLGCSISETQERIKKLQSELDPHEIRATYVTRHHEWWISGFTSSGTDFGMMKCHGIGAFINYLDHPHEIISWFQSRREEMASVTAQPLKVEAATTSALDLFAA